MSTRLPRPSDCRECGEPIRFVKLDTGSVIPVNPKPDTDDGNVAAALVGGRLVGHVIAADKPARAAQRYRFRPHFARCTEHPRKPAGTPPAVTSDPDPGTLW